MSYSLQLDGSGQIRSIVFGLWSDEAGDEYLRALKAEVDQVRKLGKPVRFLGDNTESPVQTAAVVAKFLDAMTDLVTSSDDRVAVVVASALVKLQVDRVFAKTPQARAFMHMAEAEAWIS